MKKVYLKPEVTAMGLSAMGCLMNVSGFADPSDMPDFMPQPAPTRSAVMPIPVNGSGMPQLL